MLRLCCLLLFGVVYLGSAERRVFIGTQYYRPPNPRVDDWDRDLARIRKTGVSVIRTWLYWARVNPRPGLWDFSEYDRLFDLAEKHGIQVLVQLMADVAPYWFQERHYDNLYIGRDGRPIEFHSSGMVTIGGYPGPCFHNEAARRAGEEFMRRTAKHFAGRRSLLGYDVWNEVEIEECFCPATQTRYRQYLRDTYGSVASLRRVYGRAYESFQQVRMPRTGAYKEMQDYAEFFHGVQADYMKWRVDVLRPLVGNKPLVSHWIGNQPITWRSDIWMLTGPLDVWGTSSYIGDRSPSLTRNALLETCWQFDAIRSSGRGKPWWLAEFTGGRVWSGLGIGLRTDAELQLRVLLALGFGAEAALFWQWRPEIFGQEAPNFGLTGLDGELTSRTETVRRLADAIAQNQVLFNGLIWKPAEVGLVWEPRGSIYEHNTDGPPLLYSHALGVYRALLDSGFAVDFLHARDLAAEGVPPSFKVLLMPFQVVDREGLSVRLKEWVRRGGTLLAGPNYGTYDPHTYANRRVPPDEIAEVFGARQKQNYFPVPPAINWTGRGVLPGENTVETYALASARALGFFQGEPALTVNGFGKGRGYLMGTFAGAVYDPEKNPQLAELLLQVLAASGVSQPPTATERCILRQAWFRNRQVLFVYNFEDRTVTTKIELAGGQRPARDLLSGKTADLTAIQLGPKGSVVLLLD